MIDARRFHDPVKAPGLVAQAIERCGTQRELAERTGLTRDYLRKLARSDREMSYSVQVMLECIAADE